MNNPSQRTQRNVTSQKQTGKKCRQFLKSKLGNIKPENEPAVDLIDTITNAITETIENIVPKTRKQIYKNKWWNMNLQKSKTELKRIKRKGINLDYLEKKRKFENDIALAKQKSWETFTTTVKDRNDAYIRYKILCKRKEHTALPSLNINGKWTNSTAESAQELLKTNTPDLLRPLTQEHTHIESRVESFLNNHSTIPGTVEEEPPIKLTEVRQAIREQNPGKAPGLDGIPGIVYKQTVDILSPLLTKIFNKLFEKGEFPATWSKAKVIFIKKPNKPSTDPSAHRPISLLPIVGKLYEKVILHRLNWHTRKNNLTDDNQFGFQKGISAEQAGLKLVNSITQAFKTKHEIGAVFCDISKAFPSVWNAGVLSKMIDNQFPIEYFKFMNIYLKKQSVVSSKYKPRRKN